MLEAVSRRLIEASGGSFLARVGGDEFNLIVTDAELPAAIAMLADMLLRAVTVAIDIDDTKTKVGLSIGVAVASTDGTEAATLLTNAEAALYRAKNDGRGVVRFFEAGMDQRLHEHRTIEHEFKSGIELKQLYLHYQPQTDVAGKLLGFEAPACWRHLARATCRLAFSSRSPRKTK
jgi:predicted signal transduction protein with EAL and GGDEF domain